MPKTYLFGSYRLDVDERRLSTTSGATRLTSRATNTLQALLERAREVVPKEELIARVWGEACVEEAVLTQNVYLLRRALGAEGRGIIETIPGCGYRFDGDVRRADDDPWSEHDVPRRRRSSSSPEALRHYARGRYFWNQRTARGLEKAIAELRRAIEIDSNDARAHAALADVYALQPLYSAVKPCEAFPRATSAALESIALDDGQAPAWTALAYARFLYHWDWRSAKRDFERALRFEPYYSTASHWLGFLCSAMGRHEEAIVHSRRAVELDPLSLVSACDLGLVLYSAGRPQKALEQVEMALELDRSFAYGHFCEALVRTETGDLDRAVACGKQALELQPDNPFMIGMLGHALARAGRRREAQELVGRLLEANDPAPGPLALVYTGLGEVEAAIDSLERAADERCRLFVFVPVWPAWDGLRGLDRFRRLVARLPSLSRTAAPGRQL